MPRGHEDAAQALDFTARGARPWKRLPGCHQPPRAGPAQGPARSNDGEPHMPEATRRAVLGTMAGLSAGPFLTVTGRSAAPDEEEILRQMADSFGRQLRSPIMHTPAEAGLDYEDITFQAIDGVPIEGWFIPARGSDRLIIANHPMGFTRAGYPGHLEPWKSIWTSSGNDIEVNLVPD